MKEMNGISSFVKKEKEVKIEFLLKPEITLNVDMRMAYVGIPVNAFTSSSPSKLPISLKKIFFQLVTQFKILCPESLAFYLQGSNVFLTLEITTFSNLSL